jgi:hypothetical protein
LIFSPLECGPACARAGLPRQSPGADAGPAAPLGAALDDHRADRKNWLLKTLGVPATDPAHYAWEVVAPTDPDHMDYARRLLHAVADRARWQAALTEARRRAAMLSESDLSATGRAA